MKGYTTGYLKYLKRNNIRFKTKSFFPFLKIGRKVSGDNKRYCFTNSLSLHSNNFGW